MCKLWAKTNYSNVQVSLKCKIGKVFSMKYKSLHDTKNQNASKYLSTDKYLPPLSTSSSPPQSIISGYFFCHLFPSRCCDYWLENTLIPRSTPLLLIIFIDWEGEIRFWRCAAASYCLSVHLARRPMPSRCKPPQERDPDGAGWKIEPNICNPNPFTWAHPSQSLAFWKCMLDWIYFREAIIKEKSRSYGHFPYWGGSTPFHSFLGCFS